ncbi:MAG TPA: glycerophosphodiester phosphodiesterase family protein, partial [Gemmatimonadales bacterium]|nr:glycerophosphodiester phosphodiesterase family protein [Gemmatimonadales bacterium]
MGAQSNPLLDLSARPVIAHRGASGVAPENTLAAFELAVRQGADAFELDVRLTADGVPVVLHDPTLERTTDHTGPLAALRVAALKHIDAGARFTLDRGKTFPFRAVDVRISTLAEILRRFPEMPVLLEIKEVAAQEAVRQVLIEEKAVERCVLASENHAAL